MKIIIKDANGQLAIDIEAGNEKGVSKSQVWATMSLALASMVAENIQKKGTPPTLKKNDDRHHRRNGSGCRQERFSQNRKQQHAWRELLQQRGRVHAQGV